MDDDSSAEIGDRIVSSYRVCSLRYPRHNEESLIMIIDMDTARAHQKKLKLRRHSKRWTKRLLFLVFVGRQS